MAHPMLPNSGAVEICLDRPGECCEDSDLLSYKAEFHAPDSDESEKQQRKSPRTTKPRQDEHAARTGEEGVSSHDWKYYWKKLALLLSFLLIFKITGVGATPTPPLKEFTYKDGALASIPLGSSDGRHLDFWIVERQRFEIICNGRVCDEPPVYRIDGEDILHFTANETTSGNYSLVDFNTTETVFTFRVIIQRGQMEPQNNGIWWGRYLLIGGALLLVGTVAAVVTIIWCCCCKKNQISCCCCNEESGADVKGSDLHLLDI